MALGKQAKVLSDAQQKSVISYLTAKACPERNIVMFLLSVDAGLRAKEIAMLRWGMVMDAGGCLTDAIRLPDRATKGKSGGVVYMSSRLRKALLDLARRQERKASDAVVQSRRGTALTAQVVTNWFWHLYRNLGMDGCSSHSGRRTAITKWARKISSVGGSLRDVQALARHSSLQMTQRYIEISQDACKRVVD